MKVARGMSQATNLSIAILQAAWVVRLLTVERG
jgi:hypothetical protein